MGEDTRMWERTLKCGRGHLDVGEDTRMWERTLGCGRGH